VSAQGTNPILLSENTEFMQAQLSKMASENKSLNANSCRHFESLAATLSRIEGRIGLLKPQAETPGTSLEGVTALTSRLSELSLTVSTTKRLLTKQRDIIASLNYQHRYARHDAIPMAHQQTFKWIFDPAHPAGHFVKWLDSGSGVFWIAGKPGSGKSTLMKFIADHSRTKSLLGRWAAPGKFTQGTHYFWSAGSPIQRSQEGLLRSLLLDILSQCPELTARVCEERWACPDDSLFKVMPWSLSELRAGLQSFATASELEVPKKFFFLIDGLDEYEGDHLEICQVLLGLSSAPHTKLCVSSRPWNTFSDAFGADPRTKLEMHDFTQQDIYNYVQRSLHEHPRWQAAAMEHGLSNSLFEDITQRSDGVFLWVVLVTNLLREGLTNDDGMSDLQRRLESFPRELEPFFKLMLESVEHFYHNKMAGALRVALAAREPLHPLIYAFHDMEYDDDSYALKEDVTPFWPGKPGSLVDTTTRRLNGRCRGLLEVNRAGTAVTFLHRTVKDFLETREMADFLLEKSKPGLKPSFSIFQAYVAKMKHSSYQDDDLTRYEPGSYRPSEFLSELAEALGYAASAGEECADRLDVLKVMVDNLESATQTLFSPRTDGPSNPSAVDARRKVRLMFREHVLQFDVFGYLKLKLSLAPNYFQGFERPPLALAIQSTFSQMGHGQWSSSRIRQRLDTLRQLLSSGQSPNEVFVRDYFGVQITGTPWADFMVQMFPYARVGTDPVHAVVPLTPELRAALQAGMFTLFAEHGADADVLTHHAAGVLLPAWLRLLLAPFTHTRLFEVADDYLRELRSLLCTASFGSLTSTISDSTSPWNLFCEHIEKLADGVYATAALQARRPGQGVRVDDGLDDDEFEFQTLLLVAQAIREFAEATQGSHLPWPSAQPLLRRAFPPSVLQPILDVISAPQSRGAGEPPKSRMPANYKRAGDDEEREQQSHKFRRIG